MAGQHFFDISKDAAAAGSGRADAEYFIQSVPVNFGADTRAGQERLQFQSERFPSPRRPYRKAA